MAKFRVSIYAIVRIPIEVEAGSQTDAIGKAEASVDMYEEFRSNPDAEWSDDVDGYLVDELSESGDRIEDKSRWYTSRGEIDKAMHPNL